MALRCGYLSLFTVPARQTKWRQLANLNYSRVTMATVNRSSLFSRNSSNSPGDNTNNNQKSNENQNNGNKSSDSGKREKTNKAKYIRWAGYLACGVAVTASIPVVVGALGFGAGGVVAGSIAAGVQSATAGTVLAGGVSALQSIGAAGLTLSQGALTTSGTAAGVAAGWNKLSKLRPKKKKPEESWKEQ